MAEKKIKLVEKVTWKMLEDKTEELTKLLNDFDDKADAAAIICFDAINWGSYNYFEALGILEHAADMYKQSYKEAEEKEGE